MVSLKSKAEMDAMRAACVAAAEVLQGVAELVEPGRTTRELNEAAAELIRARGGKSAFFGYRHASVREPFPGQICVSINEEVVHGIPGSRKIQYGDIVSLDVGVVLDEFIGDTATTVAVGVVEPRVLELLTVTEAALEAAIEKARVGNRVGDISSAVQGIVEARGFSVVRAFTGHGVGRSMHEDPQVPNFGHAGQGMRLKAGMTLALEPMVNMGRHEVEVLLDGWTVVTKDGLHSAHFEHTVALFEDRTEVLTCLTPTPSRSKVRS